MKNTIKALSVLAIVAGGTAAIANVPAPADRSITFKALKGTSYKVKNGNCSAKTLNGGTSSGIVSCDFKGGPITLQKSTIYPPQASDTCTLTKADDTITSNGCPHLPTKENNYTVTLN